MNTKYKTIVKKIKSMALPLPLDFKERIEKAFMQPNLRDSRKIGHKLKDKLILDGLRVESDGF